MAVVNEVKDLIKDSCPPSKKKKKKEVKTEASDSFGSYLFKDWKVGKLNPKTLYDELEKLGYDFGVEYEYFPVNKGGITITDKKMFDNSKVQSVLNKFFKRRVD